MAEVAGASLLKYEDIVRIKIEESITNQGGNRSKLLQDDISFIDCEALKNLLNIQEPQPKRRKASHGNARADVSSLSTHVDLKGEEEFVGIWRKHFEIALDRDSSILDQIKNELKGHQDLNTTSPTFNVGIMLRSKHCVLSFKNRYDDYKIRKTAGPFMNLVFHMDEDLSNILSAVNSVQAYIKKSRKQDQQNIQCVWELGVSTKSKQSHDATISLNVQINWAARSSPDLSNDKLPVLLMFFLNQNQKENSHEVRHYVASAKKLGASSNITAREFYDSLYVPPQDEIISDKVQVAELTTALFPFQRRTVKWLMEKEAVHFEDDIVVEEKSDKVPEMFEKFLSLEGKICYTNALLGWVSTHLNAFSHNQVNLRGGILAEEMGLGKTVELISLISLHRRKMNNEDTIIYDYFSGKDVKISGCTLVISPPALIKQWLSELEVHAPGLRVYHYQGTADLSIRLVKAKRKQNTSRSHATQNEEFASQEIPNSDLVDKLLQYDIVLTTYSVLATEIHYAEDIPQRSMRNTRKYVRRMSPLVQISWWRICLDEAQMVENGVSAAAQVARIIPRVNAWAVTGTPIQKGIDDLFGLLLFLRLDPWGYNKNLWQRLKSDKTLFQSLFHNITLRHTKHVVSNDIKLPPQRRVVISVPFSEVEDANYNRLFEDACAACGVKSDGSPLADDWDPSDEHTTQQMRTWLGRLRQTCVHPQVGASNKKALGGAGTALQTVDEVLDIMIANNESSTNIDQRLMFTTLAKRAQLMLEAQEDPKSAIALLEAGLRQVQEVLDHMRQELETYSLSLKESSELQIQNKDVKGKGKEQREEQSVSEDADMDDIDVEDYNKMDKTRLMLNRRIQEYIEVKHNFVFNLGNAYFVRKTQLENDNASENIVNEFTNLENKYYEDARALRRELMSETEMIALRHMNKLQESADNMKFVEIPEIDVPELRGGLESASAVEKFTAMAEALNDQANALDEWRESCLALLLVPLVDQEDEAKGDELDKAALLQESGYLYLDQLRLVVADRYEALAGIQNAVMEGNFKYAATRNEGRDEVNQKLYNELMKEREKVRPTVTEAGNAGEAYEKSMKAMVGNIKRTIAALKLQENSTRSKFEIPLAEGILQFIQTTLKLQGDAVKQLEDEIEHLTTVFNTRLEFYRQLQAVSDMLRPLDQEKESQGVILKYKLSKDSKEWIERCLKDWESNERRFRERVAASKAKGRYLEHLKLSSSESENVCTICQDPFQVGVLTICGHKFCGECIRAWYTSHRTCPVCKRNLNKSDMHRISYKPAEMTLEEDEPGESSSASPALGTSIPPSGTNLNIYTSINKTILNQIKAMSTEKSFGSKIDMIMKHLLWLRTHNRGSKSVIFTQWKDVINVLQKALDGNRIRYSSLEDKDGVTKFKTDQHIEVFLLHAKAQASGLTLVEASNVFLCEPLVNTGLELQAIARVHRIGQQRETRVWLYIIANSVEESVLTLSTRRRLEMMGANRKGNKVSATDNNHKNGKKKAVTASSRSVSRERDMSENDIESMLENANSNELLEASAKMMDKTPGGGEVVNDDDLWKCLFGVSRKNRSEAQVTTRRHLTATAAEQRTMKGIDGSEDFGSSSKSIASSSKN